MKEMTVADLRDLVSELISPTINMHRASREDEDYILPEGPPTDEEVDDFLLSNPLLEIALIEQLVDPGLLGHISKNVTVSEEWLKEFKYNIKSWAENHSWLGADQSWLTYIQPSQPNESEIWIPNKREMPVWLNISPSYLLIAKNLIKNNRMLSEMNWRDFEYLIGHLLEAEGWKVKVSRGTKDGGIDIVAIKDDPIFGVIKSLWQAKKYGPKNKVELSDVRELSAVRDDNRATKGFIVTTSQLTRGAIEWVKRDVYRLGYKEHKHLVEWINGIFLG